MSDLLLYVSFPFDLQAEDSPNIQQSRKQLVLGYLTPSLSDKK